MTKKKLDQLKWLESQQNKDKIELENEKLKLISSLKGLKKEDVLPTVVIFDRGDKFIYLKLVQYLQKLKSIDVRRD